VQGVSFVNANGGNTNYFKGSFEAVYPDAAHVTITDQGRNITFNGMPGGFGTYGVGDNSNNFNEKISVAYVTGSHSFKAGLQTLQGQYDTYGMPTSVNQFNYQFFLGVPTTIVQFAGPFSSKVRISGQALFAMDQWTVSRLTLNLGVRFDHFSGHTLA